MNYGLIAIVGIFLLVFLYLTRWVINNYKLWGDIEKLAKPPPRPPQKPPPGAKDQDWEKYIDYKLENFVGQPYDAIWEASKTLQEFLKRAHDNLCLDRSSFEGSLKECQTLVNAQMYLQISVALASNNSRVEKRKVLDRYKQDPGANEMVQRAAQKYGV